jgi:hypothetical protein
MLIVCVYDTSHHNKQVILISIVLLLKRNIHLKVTERTSLETLFIGINVTLTIGIQLVYLKYRKFKNEIIGQLL